jgi:hypothetical protein
MVSIHEAVGSFILISLAFVCLDSGARAGDPADLVRHVEKIRELGMTEAALADLDRIAAIRTGEQFLTFVEGETPGEYVLSLADTSCKLPEAAHGRTAQLQTALRKATVEDREALRAHADADGSGFVSTEEAAELRDLIEFGYLAAWMAGESVASLDRIADSSSLAPEDAEAKVARYNRLAGILNAETRHRMPVIRLNTDG